MQVNAPPSAQPGPINVKILQPNGIQVFDPLAFSYGPAPLFLSGDTGSPSGGALADIVALGVPADASKIQVSVGGAAAQVLSAMPFNPGAAGLDVSLNRGRPGAVASRKKRPRKRRKSPADGKRCPRHFNMLRPSPIIHPRTLFKPLPMTREERICISQQGTMWMFSR